MDTQQESVSTFFASTGSLNEGFSFIGPFSSNDEAMACDEQHGELQVIEAATAGYTFLITDGQPGSTIYAGFAREHTYEKSRRVALEECAANWGRDDTEGLEIVCSIFGDVSFKEIAPCR